jgi:hypothetical protein
MCTRARILVLRAHRKAELTLQNCVTAEHTGGGGEDRKAARKEGGRKRRGTLTKSVREFSRPATITSRAASYKLSDMINLGAGEHRRQKQIANKTTRTTNARLHALLLRPALRAQYLPSLGRYLRRSPATDSFLPI